MLRELTKQQFDKYFNFVPLIYHKCICGLLLINARSQESEIVPSQLGRQPIALFTQIPFRAIF